MQGVEPVGAGGPADRHGQARTVRFSTVGTLPVTVFQLPSLDARGKRRLCPPQVRAARFAATVFFSGSVYTEKA
ncbi:hypothetical protein AB0D89_32000 [Streptomyces luteogriseus]|uniref:hypothetical protein n=1 Tax=Streptomyces luteogriseus TaxID=68233 RepID=UPI0033C71C28